jgi:DNA-binding transcriptional MerR regulator
MVEREQVQVLPTPVEKAEGSRRRWQLIEADTLAKIQEEFDAELTLEQTATVCGVSTGAVRALVKARLLPALRGPAHGGASEWAFDKQAIRQTLSRLIGNLPIRLKAYSADDSCLTLSQALRIVTPAGIALPALLQAVENGQVACVRVTEDLTLSGLRFERASLLTFVAEKRPAEHDNVLSKEEVRQRLHCSASTLDRWHKTRLLVPCDQSMVGAKRRWHYRSQDVATFAERFITAKEAAFLLGCNQLTVQNRARTGALPAVSGQHIDGSHSYRFERAALLRLRQERISSREVKQQLGISKATLHRWVRQGRLTPLTRGRGKHCWFSAEEVRQLVR